MSHDLATDIDSGRSGSPAEPLWAGGLAQWFAAAATGLLLAAAVTLVWRRLAGVLEVPLSWQSMLSAGVLLGAAATAARATRRCSRRAGMVAAGLLSVGMLSVGLALSVPGTSWTAIAAFWVPVAAGEIWAWRRRGRNYSPASVPAPSWQGRKPAATTKNSSDPFLLQQQTRSRADDGTETLRGWLRAAIAAGQRSASVHVAFCPPFARTPQVLVEQREGPPARIKAVQVLPHGARFDLKLGEPSGSAGFIVLEFSAEETRVSREAEG